MTARSVVVLFPLLLLAGCSASQKLTVPDPQSELISLTPLPPLTGVANGFGVKLSAVFHVVPDGSVKEVSLLRPGVDPEWDRSALDSLKRWRFVSIADDKNAVDRWVRYAIVVQVQEPMMMRLAEMVVPTRGAADSLFSLLKGGADFEALGLRASAGKAEWSWKPAESVNLARYPDQVRGVVSMLHVGEVTEPVRLGLNYVIFKRYRSPE